MRSAIPIQLKAGMLRISFRVIAGLSAIQSSAPWIDRFLPDGKMDATAYSDPEIKEDVMASQDKNFSRNRAITRRQVLQGSAGAGALALTGLATSKGAMAGPGAASPGEFTRAQDGSIVFVSSQLTPIAEAEALRNTILADFEGEVDFVPEDPGPFNDRIQA